MNRYDFLAIIFLAISFYRAIVDGEQNYSITACAIACHVAAKQERAK